MQKELAKDITELDRRQAQLMASLKLDFKQLINDITNGVKQSAKTIAVPNR